MSKKILIVDDDPVVVKLAESRLKANGYEVLTSNDAPSGLEMAINEAPDLIILDVMMPIVNGYNFCRLLKQQEQKTIPVIFLTSRADEEDQAIGQEVGANAYLTKPFNMRELLNKVAELLSIG